MYQTFFRDTSWRESQLSADYISIGRPPHVVTHCSPCCIIANLNSTLSIIHTTTKPYVPICTSYKGTQWECKIMLFSCHNLLLPCVTHTQTPTSIVQWNVRCLTSPATSYSDRRLQRLQNGHNYDCQLHCGGSSLVDFQCHNSAHHQAR